VKMEPVKITKLEKQLLTDLAHSDHSSDGHGFTMWVGVGYETLPMRQVRALITTLQEKGVISYEPPCRDWPGHIGPVAKFIEGGERGVNMRGGEWVKPDHDKFPGEWDNCPFEDGCFGCKYINLEVIE